MQGKTNDVVFEHFMEFFQGKQSAKWVEIYSYMGRRFRFTREETRAYLRDWCTNYPDRLSKTHKTIYFRYFQMTPIVNEVIA